MKFCTILFLFLLAPFLANAQWIQSEGINGASVTSFVATDSMLFCSAPNIFRTAEDSIYWHLISSGYSNLFVAGECVFDIIPPGTFGNRSLDNGETWEEVDFPANTSSGIFATAGQSAFITVMVANFVYNVCRSDDYGITWDTLFSCDLGMPLSICTSDSNVFVTFTQSQIFHSNDLGNTWDTLSDSGINDHYLWDIFKFHSDYWLTNSDGVFRYNNISEQWIFQQSSPLRDYSSFQDNLYAIGEGILLYDSINDLWIPKNDGLETSRVNCLFVKDSVFYCGTSLGPYRASYSLEWEPVFNGLHGGYVTSLSCNGEECWITTDFGVYRSLDNGQSFEKQEVPDDMLYYKIIITDSTYYLSGGNRFYFSDDQGFTWQIDTAGLFGKDILDMTVACGEVFIICRESYDSVWVFKSIPGYSNWETTSYYDSWLKYIAGNDTAIITVQNRGNALDYPFRITYDKFLNAGIMTVIPEASHPYVKYSDGSFLIGDNSALYYSDDNGLTWTEIDIYFPDGIVKTTTKKDDKILASGYMCGAGAEVYATFNLGADWLEITDNLPSIGLMQCSDLNINGERIFLSTYEMGLIYRDDIISGVATATRDKQKMIIYPNPSSDKITIRTEANFSGMITISDILGNIILKEKKTASNEYIIRDLKQGVYTVTLTDEKRILTGKFLKVDN